MKKENMKLIGVLAGGIGLGILLKMAFKGFNLSFYLPRKPPISRLPYPKRILEQPATVFGEINSDYIVAY